MSRRTVQLRRRYEQARGNDFVSVGMNKESDTLRDPHEAMLAIMPREAKGKKSGKVCTEPVSPNKWKQITDRVLSTKKGR